MTILAGQRIRALDFAGDAYDFETATDTTASTTYVDGTINGVAFTAPTSGKVWIHWGGFLGSNAVTVGNRAYLSIYVRTGSTVDAGTDVLAASDDIAGKYYKQTTTAGPTFETVAFAYQLTGLTAGSAYNVITQFRATQDTASVDNRWVIVTPVFI